MSALAIRNGWRGFDGIGEKVEAGGFGLPPERGGWLYRCDGMPSAFGCGGEVIVPRRWVRVGTKGSGWVVMYGAADDGTPGDDGKGNDVDVVLTFCPKCAAVVREQHTARAAEDGGAEGVPDLMEALKRSVNEAKASRRSTRTEGQADRLDCPSCGMSETTCDASEAGCCTTCQHDGSQR